MTLRLDTAQNRRAPFGTICSGLISSTRPCSSGKSSASTCERNGTNLVSLLDDYLEGSTTFSVMWPSSRHLTPKIRAFVDFAVEKLLPGKLTAHPPNHVTIPPISRRIADNRKIVVLPV